MWANAHCATFIYKFHYIKLAGTHWMQHKQKHKRKPSRNCFENKAEGFSLFWNVFFRPSLWLDSCTCAYFYINPYFRHFTASHFFNLLSSCLCLYAWVQWGSGAGSGAKLARSNSGGVCLNCPAKTDDALQQIFISGLLFCQNFFRTLKKRVEKFFRT